MQRDQWQRRWQETAFSNTPRAVPLSVRLRILLGGFTPQFGWYFVGFGGIFVWIFGGSQALHNLVFFSGELREVEGTVVSVVKTNTSVNEHPIYAYHYTYEVGTSSCEGVTKAFGGAYDEGDVVPVEYALADPDRSRIRDLSVDAGWGICIAVIFPIIGLCFLSTGVRKGIKGARLLRHGELAVGELVAKEPTNVRINDQTVWKFTFCFVAAGGQSCEVVAKTHKTERFAGEEDPGHEQHAHDAEKSSAIREPLLYNPMNPHDAVLLDDLPGGPRINERGEIEGRFACVVFNLVIPGLTVFGHGAWLLHVLEVI